MLEGERAHKTYDRPTLMLQVSGPTVLLLEGKVGILVPYMQPAIVEGWGNMMLIKEAAV